MTSLPQKNPVFSTPPPVTTTVQGGSASGFQAGWDPAAGFGMPPEFFIPTLAAQFGALATRPMVNQQSAPATQPAAQNTSFPQMTGQVNASAAPPMTPQQHLTVLVQPATPRRFWCQDPLIAMVLIL